MLPCLHYDWSASRDVTFLGDDVTMALASDVAILVFGVVREGREEGVVAVGPFKGP